MTLETITPKSKTIDYEGICPFCDDYFSVEIILDLEHVNGETTACDAHLDGEYPHNCQPKETR